MRARAFLRNPRMQVVRTGYRNEPVDIQVASFSSASEPIRSAIPNDSVASDVPLSNASMGLSPPPAPDRGPLRRCDHARQAPGVGARRCAGPRPGGTSRPGAAGRKVSQTCANGGQFLAPLGGRQDRLRSETKPTMGWVPGPRPGLNRAGTRAAKTDSAMRWWPRGTFYCNARVEM